MKYWNIEVSKNMYDIISSMFQILELPTPKPITSSDMEKILESMYRVKKNNKYSNNIINRIKIINDKIKPVVEKNNILVIAKQGTTRYQLKYIFNNNNYEVTAIQDKYFGLAEYIKKLYDFIILDTTEDFEDLAGIVNEIKRIASHYSKDTTIVFLVNSDFDPTSILNVRINKLYINKKDHWQEQLLNEINDITMSMYL